MMIEISLEQYNDMAERLAELEWRLGEAVQVVRCRDCRWFDKGENEVDSWEYCTRLGHHPQSDGFCAWGEREKDGNGEEG